MNQLARLHGAILTLPRRVTPNTFTTKLSEAFAKLVPKFRTVDFFILALSIIARVLLTEWMRAVPETQDTTHRSPLRFLTFRRVLSEPVMAKSRAPAGRNHYPENGLVKPPRRDTRALGPAGMFGGKAQLRLAA